MKTLFDPADRSVILARIEVLRPESARQWGKMVPSQMLCHCARALESATGDRPMKQKLIGKLLAPLVWSSMMGEKPFSKNSPTDPSFVVSDTPDFDAERTRVVGLINRFADGGAAQAENRTHGFFGKLTGDEWGRLMHKHLDHHLQQFGV